MAKRKWTKLIAINALVFVTLLMIAEGVAWILVRAGHSRVIMNPDYQVHTQAGAGTHALPSSWERDWQRLNTNDFPRAGNRELVDSSRKWMDMFEWHANGAMTIKPNRVSTSKLSLTDGTVIYDSTVSTDAFGRRTTISLAAPPPDKHLLFFGCSFTWGEGVADDQTLPSQTAQYLPGYRGYNFGKPGAGPADMLWSVRSLGQLENVTEHDGIAIFSLISDHVARTISSFSVVGVWGPQMIEAVEEPGGVIRADRSHKYESPLRTVFSSVVMRSQLARLTGFNWPPAVKPEHFAFTARTIAALRDEYLKKFPNGRFYVVLFPLATHLSERVLPELEKLGIAYLDYSRFQIWQYTEKPIVFPYDAHPTAEAYRMVGKQLAADLRAIPAPAVASR